MNAEHCKFEVGLGNSVRKFCQVHICSRASFSMKQIFQKKIFSCFSCLMVPTKMVQISFCVFLTIWLEIVLPVLEQLLRSPYVYTVYLADLLACLTKDQQSSSDILQRLPPEDIISKLGLQKELSLVCLTEKKIFSLVYNYNSQEGLIYLLLNVSQASSMEPLDPGEWPPSLTRENDARNPCEPRDLAHSSVKQN